MPETAPETAMRGVAFAVVALAYATVVTAQPPDAASERTRQRAGESGAAASHTITPGTGPANAHEITSTATASVSLSADQRRSLKTYFSQPRRRATNQAAADFTISVGAAVPKQVVLKPFAPALADILPMYKGDHYVVVQRRLVIVTPNRRIVAIIPDVSG